MIFTRYFKEYHDTIMSKEHITIVHVQKCTMIFFIIVHVQKYITTWWQELAFKNVVMSTFWYFLLMCAQLKPLCKGRAEGHEAISASHRGEHQKSYTNVHELSFKVPVGWCWAGAVFPRSTRTTTLMTLTGF